VRESGKLPPLSEPKIRIRKKFLPLSEPKLETRAEEKKTRAEKEKIADTLLC
jgi:hypothetical protein